MTSRVFISYRASDGADKATALARDLDALFGSDQIFLDKEDLPAGCRWRDEIARALGAQPVLLVLVTPDYFGAREADGTRRIDRADDPVRDELEAGIAARAQIIPVLCDGVEQIPDAADLPPPFDQLSERTWRRLRAYDWREDLGRLGADLRALGLQPRVPPTQPATTPLPLAPGGATGAPVAPPMPARRRALAALVAVAGAAAAVVGWRWWQRRRADLSGVWTTRIGARGARSSRDGEIALFTLRQDGAELVLESAPIDIGSDADWENYRDFWKQKTGTELTHIVYRGEGKVIDGEATAPGAPRRIVVAVRIELVGSGSEPIDGGTLRGTVDPDDRHIRGKLWINSEQGERFVDLRRQP